MWRVFLKVDSTATEKGTLKGRKTTKLSPLYLQAKHTVSHLVEL